MKNIKKFAVLILLIISARCWALAPVVGYGYATSVLPAKNQEAFLSGFELGFKKILGYEAFRTLVIVERDTTGSPAGAIKTLSRLQEKGVSLITGFPTSHEALQVADITKNTGQLTIFPSAGHSRLSSMGANIVTTGESMKGYVKQTTEFLMNKFKNKSGLMVYNPEAVFSVNQKDEFENYIRNLPAHNKPGDIEFVRRAISLKKHAIITGAIWIPGSKESLPFEKMAKQVYGIMPTTDIAAGFDVGVITATVLKRTNGNYSKSAIIKAFSENRCFSGISFGKICFPKEGGNGDGKLKFRYLTKQGLSNI
ncbi:MAG: amino acid ABC transporter substrate-binding protein [Deltaproteobacteria bacterium]|nr:amino acid ABC transporter substrate-binding protein [Deltaproteobacteria bacterium]